MCLLLSFVVIFGFDAWTGDVPQAYLQSSEPLVPDVYIKNPAPGFELDPVHCLYLLKPLYGLWDAGDLWHATIDNHHRQGLGMTLKHIDRVLYYIIKEGIIKRLKTAYVDDLLRAGDPDFREISNRTNLRFKMKDDPNFLIGLTGFMLDKNEKGEFVMDQTHYRTARMYTVRCLILQVLVCMNETGLVSRFKTWMSILHCVACKDYRIHVAWESPHIICGINKTIRYAVDNFFTFITRTPTSNYF